ncbi:outer membrane lipid asymmetry maintenance protein MlaD [Sphingosinicella soli]|uniref:Phospholipid/cholesterol/gamma-HCH transport system substrate-binding protein n=1 Tax=Sphingosinicella soli TaxID=333708 RepID=A0A7W7F6G5_9SPHN|nr:outer membrane lipid asymmetry maintenance protein MlaD [Sphingosinicella soli]MBB4632495.1 phospholipid/cholesterol/gamma-HCH transport system substrate-binding protein [Sphingosinicella soli]
MTALFRQNLIEAIVGAIVVGIAVVFVLFSYQRTSGNVGADRYRVSALFPNATGVAVGTDVRVSGIKVGSVVDQTLDPETFQARLGLSIDQRIALPLDSSAAITSEGILGGSYISLTPGGDSETMREGDEIIDTQGSVDLMTLIGGFINQSGGQDDKAGDAAPAEPAAP